MLKMFFIFLVFLFEKQFLSKLVYNVFGGLTDTSFKLVAKSDDNASITIMLNGQNYGSFNPAQNGYYYVTVNNLVSNRLYYVQIMSNGSPVAQANITTLPTNSTIGDFSFAISAGTQKDTSSQVYQKIHNWNPNFFLMLGNFEQKNYKNDPLNDFETAYLDVFANNYTQPLFQQIPMVYTFDDSEWGGDKSTSKSEGLDKINAIYRQMFPYYNIMSNSTIGVQQSFQISDILFIITDSRSFLDPESNTIFGQSQLNWIIGQLQLAAVDPNIRGIVITMTQPYNYVKSRYEGDMIKQIYYTIIENMQGDKFAIGNATKSINFNKPNEANFKSLLMVIGDQFVGFDDGRNNPYGGFPVLVCGSLDNRGQCKGGPYSHGQFFDSLGQYCRFRVVHRNGKACFNLQGVLTENNKNDTMLFQYDTCNPDLFPGHLNQKCPIDWTEKLLNSAIAIVGCFLVFVFFYVFLTKLAIRALSLNKVKIE